MAKLYIERPKTKQITIRLTKTVYTTIKRIADKENVSIPEVCRALLNYALKEQNLIK